MKKKNLDGDDDAVAAAVITPAAIALTANGKPSLKKNRGK
jgi:hypothetical protein